MKGMKKKTFVRFRRKRRVRGKVSGTPDRPRMTVFRSHKNIYVQIVDDVKGCTLVSASSRDKGFGEMISYGGNKAAAVKVGEAVAERAKGVGIEQVVFDRNGYRYHGRLKELAEAARKGGLKF